MMNMKRLTRILTALLSLAILCFVGVYVWAEWSTPDPLPVAIDALIADETVLIEESGSHIIFRPATGAKQTGLILYPGGFVEPASYALHARGIVAAGYPVILIKAPLNLAFTALNGASNYIDDAQFSAVEKWVVGGHSLGGNTAALFTEDNLERVDGLLLWASYPPESTDLSQTDLAVLSLYGTADGVISKEELDASRANLPASAQFVAVEGGNHAQFGSYGAQDGDSPATISAADQVEIVVRETVQFLAEIDETE